MPLDPSILLSGRGVTSPDPMALAQQGLTLGNLANQQQMNQLTLRAAQETQQAVPEFTQRLARGEDINQIAGDMASRYPNALPKLLQDYKAQQLTQSQISKENALAREADMKSKVQALDTFGKQAYGISQSQGPINPMQIGQIVAQAKFLGLPTDGLPSVMDQQGLKQWLANAGNAAAGILDQVKANVEKTMLPVNVAEKQAATNKTNVEAGLAPGIAQSGRISANAAASNAQSTRMGLVAPQVQISEATGLPVAIGRFNSSGQPEASVTPISGPQMKPTPMQKDLAGATAKEIGNLQNSAVAARQGLQSLTAMKSMEAKGIYSGGIQGTDTFKTLANVWAGTGLATQDQLDQLANTQAWDAKSGELVAQMLKQLGGNRITNNELNFIQRIKPNTLQTEAGRQMLYGALEKSFKNQIDTADQAARYVQQPGQYTLSGFVPDTGNVPTQSLDDWKITRVK